MMRDFSFVFLFLLLSLIGFATAEEALVASDRIKVFLFAAPAFHAEVGVDLKNNTCLSLDNNLIDGKVKSVLVGGKTVWEVMKRKDKWYCVLWDNHECKGGEEARIFVPGGENNLGFIGDRNWGLLVHGLQCFNPVSLKDSS